MARERRRSRDRDLGQAPGDGEQDQPAERLTEPEAGIERVRRLREDDARSPRDAGGGREDKEEKRRRETCDGSMLLPGPAGLY
jgi:hypothetical protein